MSDTRVTHLDLPRECNHIVDRALAGDNALVQMGCLLFLAFSNGDAFALDLDDNFACPLCLEGEKQPYPLVDTGSQWAFQWPWSYHVAQGRIHFETTDEGGPVAMQLVVGTIERKVNDYNRKAGTNYHL
jgi:hypothetical protein